MSLIVRIKNTKAKPQVFSMPYKYRKSTGKSLVYVQGHGCNGVAVFFSYIHFTIILINMDNVWDIIIKTYL